MELTDSQKSVQNEKKRFEKIFELEIQKEKLLWQKEHDLITEELKQQNA